MPRELELDERLKLAAKFRQMEEELSRIIACAREIVFEAEEIPRTRPIIEQAKEIERIANRLMD